MNETTLKQRQRASLGHVLFTCGQLLDELAQAEINAEAGERLARPAIMRLLPHLDFDGIRPTELARRLDISKQAVHQSVAALEAQGLVELVADSRDGRARNVRLTARGAAAFHHGLGVLQFFERALAKRLGEAEVRRTLEGLQAMLDVLSEWKQGPAPTRRRAARARR